MIDAGGLPLSKQWTGQRLANNGGNCIFIAWPGPGPIPSYRSGWGPNMETN